jgi:flagellar motor switch protein FliM
MLEEPTDVESLDLLDTLRAPQMRSLLMENLSDRFMRQIAFALFQRTRSSVSLLSCINGVMSHEAALSSLPDVLLAGIADLAPLRGRMLLAIDGDLIGAIVDALCGATTPVPHERYELSAMEVRIGKQMIDLSLSMISETLSVLQPLDLKAISYENASGMLAIADGQDWMIAATGIFDSALGGGTIRLIAPYAGFEPLEAKFGSQSLLMGQRGADSGWIMAIESLSEQTPVEVRFDVARANVPLAVFDNLHIGQVLPFFLSAEAIGVAGGIDLFRADYGQSEGYICCRVKAEGQKEGDASMADQKERTGAATAGAGPAERGPPAAETERVELERIQAQPRGAPVISAKSVLDRVQVALTVELGRTQITVKDLRQLRHGQVVSLEQMIGEPLTIFANGQKLAYGEVVAVPNDRYGVRITALAEDVDKSEDNA